MTTKIKVAKCKQHPDYQGKLKPRCDCKDCWVIFDWYTAKVAGRAQHKSQGELSREELSLEPIDLEAATAKPTTVVQASKPTRAQHGDDGRFLKGNSIACRPNKKLKRHRGELDYLRELVSKYGPEGHNRVLDAIIAHATDDTSDKQTQAWTLLCKYVYGKVPLSDLNSRTVIG